MADSAEDNQTKFRDLIVGLQGPVSQGIFEKLLFGDLCDDQNDFNYGMPVKDGYEGPTRKNSPELIALTLEIAQRNYEKILNLPKHETPEYLACGGGPGVGKSTALFRAVAERYGVQDVLAMDWSSPTLAPQLERLFLDDNSQIPAVLVAPDRGGLMQLLKARYGAYQSSPERYAELRAASNFLSNYNLAVAVTECVDIVHDTTLGSSYALSNIQKLKDSFGYAVSLLLCSAPIETRQTAVDGRNGGFFQSLPANFVAQEAGFAAVLGQVVELADRVAFGWRTDVGSAQEWGAYATNERGLVVVAEDQFDTFKAMYPSVDWERVGATPRRPVADRHVPDSSPNPR